MHACRSTLEDPTGLALAVDAGGLPGVSPGIEGGGALLLGPWRVGARITVLPSSVASLPDDPERGGRFTQVFGVGTFGRALLPWRGGGSSHELAAAVGFEAGATFAAGFGVDNTREETVPWLAPRIGLGGRIGLVGGLGVRGEAGAAVPLISRAFVLDAIGEIHTITPVALRLGLGLDARF